MATKTRVMMYVSSMIYGITEDRSLDFFCCLRKGGLTGLDRMRATNLAELLVQ